MNSYRVIAFSVEVVLMIGMLLASTFHAGAQPADPSYPCDGAFYLVTSNSAGSKLQRIVRDTATGTVEAAQIPLSEPSIRMTCLGYSVRDMHLYALDFDTYDLLRINATGHVVRLGVPENLNTADYEYFAGDVNPNGTVLVVIGRDKVSGVDKIIYSIDLTDPRHYAGSVSVVSSVPVVITDFATDPISGVRYGFDRRNRKLITFGNGEVSTYQFDNITPSPNAFFFDQRGRLFGYGDPAGGSANTRLFSIDKNTGLLERLAWQGATGEDSDGCSCPYTVQFSRTVSPATALPCTEVTIEYEIINQTGTGRLGGTFLDLLPPVFTISRIEENTASLSTLVAGPGGNLLELKNYDMRLGRNVLRLIARVEENAEGSYNMQASVDNLPRALGETLLSDNPATPVPDDPNVVQIAEPESLDLNILTAYNCRRDSVTLSIPIDADSVIWSTGATTPFINVPASGQYWVDVVGECFDFRDTLNIVNTPDTLALNLGPDRSLQLGEEIVLSFTGNYKQADLLQYKWKSSTGQGLSCTDCPNPRFQALEDAVITLQLTDASGCNAEDEVLISVNTTQKVYLPNAFSPNGDGSNDRFFPQGTAGQIKYFRIFNRWGALVYDAEDTAVNDPQSGWDGSINGRPAEEGIYIFSLILTFPDGEEEMQSGELMLIR